MQSLSRALGLLDRLARQPHPSSLTELADAVGLHKSTVHRMLATFLEHDLVRRDEANRYAVGVGAFELARAARCDDGPDPVLVRSLTRAGGRPGVAVTYYRGRPGQLEPVLTVRDGEASTGSEATETHWHASAAGKAFLSVRPKEELDRLLLRSSLPALTPRTMTDPFRVRQVVARTRLRGYAVEDREVEVDRRALAVPVVGQGGVAMGVVEAVLPPGPCGPVEVRSLAATLVACADEIAVAMLDVHRPAPLAPVPALPGVGA